MREKKRTPRSAKEIQNLIDNTRVILYESMIGHSFFIKNSEKTDTLMRVDAVRKKVIGLTGIYSFAEIIVNP